MINTHIIKSTIELAETSPAHQFRHAAIVYDKHGRILGQATNQMDVCDLAGQLGYRRKRMHAEGLALYRAFGKIRKDHCRKLFLISVRINRLGELRLAKPCSVCERILKRYRVNVCYYSTEKGISSYCL